MALKIFVSHSSKDKDYAHNFEKLLRRVFGLKGPVIRISSVEAAQLMPGDEINGVLRREIRECKVFVALISKNSLGSNFAQYEIAARWGTEEPLLTVLLPDVAEGALEPPLNSLHAVKSTRHGIMQLIAKIGEVLEEEADDPELWNEELERLLSTEVSSLDPIGYAVLSYVVDAEMNFALLEYPRLERNQPPGRRFDFGELPHEVALQSASYELSLPIHELEFFPPEELDLYSHTSTVPTPFATQYEHHELRSAKAHHDQVFVFTINRTRPPVKVRLENWRKENPDWYTLEEVRERLEGKENRLKYPPHDDMPKMMARIVARIEKHRRSSTNRGN